MPSPVSLVETIDHLLRNADPAKLASEAPAPARADGPGAGLRKLAEALAASDPRALTALDYGDLHAVKTAAVQAPAPAARPALPADATPRQKQAAQLRDLGDALDSAHAQLAQQRREKAARVLVAAKGLSILRDKLRGT